MPDPRPARLALVGDDTHGSTAHTVSAPLPSETSPTPETAPNLLAALDAGDQEAVTEWLRAHTPESASLLVYGLLIGAGVIGMLEWPAVVISAVAQLVVDRRLGGIENLLAELRAVAEGRS